MLTKEATYSIAICTRNRAQLLALCLGALADAVGGRAVPVLIVDNASMDNTKEVAESFADRLNISYLLEPTLGLSHARNKAWQACVTDYIIYLDDDAKPLPQWVPAVEEGIRRYSPLFFGGPYKPFYLTRKSDWFMDDYGSMHLEKHEGPLPEGQNLSGGNMGWKVQLLRELGGFPTELGMIGETMGLGEETYLQNKARQEQEGVGYFLKDMVMLHYVPPEKMLLSYWCRRQWQRGWQDREVNLGRRRFRLRTLIYEIGIIPVYTGGIIVRDRRVDPSWKGYFVRKFCPRLAFWGSFASQCLHWSRKLTGREKIR